MPRPLAYLGFERSLNGQSHWGRITASPGGSEQYGPGILRSSAAILSHISTENIGTDPYMVNGQNGYGDWTGGNAPIELDAEVVPPDWPVGGHSAKQTATTGTYLSMGSSPGVSFPAGTGRIASLSVWARHDCATDTNISLTINAWVDDWSGSPPGSRQVNFSVPPKTWTRLWIDGWEVPDDAVHPMSFIQMTADQNGGRSLWVTGTQMEMQDHATPLCPALDASGEPMPGFAWKYDAHNSTSTRASSRVQADMPEHNGVQQYLPTDGGSIAIRFAFAYGWQSSLDPWNDHEWGGIVTLVGTDYHDVIELGYYLSSVDGHIYAHWGDWGSSNWSQNIDLGLAEDVAAVPHTIVMDWDHTEIGVQIDGGDRYLVTRSHPGTTDGSHRIDLANNASGLWYDDVAAFGFIPDDQQRATLADPSKPWSSTLLEVRAPVITRRREEFGRGVYTIQPTLWRTNMQRTLIEPLEIAKPHKARVTFNDTSTIKRQLSFDVLNPSALTELGDFVLPELKITDPDGREQTMRLGHFIVLPPSLTTNTKGQTGAVQGRDMTYLLDWATFPDGYVVSEGTNGGAAVRDILRVFGIPNPMISVPDSPITIAEERVYEPGDRMLPAINEILTHCAMYTLWTTGTGVVISRPIVDVTQLAPVSTYRSADGATVVPDIREDQDISELFNRVTVRRTRNDEPTIYYTAEVTDESSPIHPERLKERMGAGAPVVRAADVITNNDIETEAEAKAIAEARLSEAGTKLRRVDLTTILDPKVDGHQVVNLDVRNGRRGYYTGRWLRRSFTVDLDGPKATMGHTLNAVVGWR